MKRNVIIILLMVFFPSTQAQGLLTEKDNQFTHQDSLRGSITPERAWWDLTYYHLDVEVFPETKFIKGKNTVQYKVLEPNSILQIDLQSPLSISKIVQDGKELSFKSDGNAHFIKLKKKQKKGSIQSLDVYYEGTPKEAPNAPWDGGFSWKKDENDKHFIATSCQGLGASVWWPNKDHMYDEVDSMLISVTNPKELTNVSNGRLRSKKVNDDDTVTSHWFVNNPINNYGVNINIGDYVHFSEDYTGEKGNLTLDFYVLKDHLEEAKVHFRDAQRTLRAFEYWFGPYPFYEDGYKLVEAPYLGMEHQSSVTYGNKFRQGQLGRDSSGTGWGLTFDYIIIHETGHEWFANNITYIDIADMWIHESFTCYSENLFLDYHYGKVAASEFVIGQRRNRNENPLIGPYNVNQEAKGDLYNGGANMLHTIRQLVNDDEKWRQILRGLNSTFYHQTVTTKQIEDYISDQSGIDLTAFFNQYLRDGRRPTLEYSIANNELKYRWTNTIENFEMPIEVQIDGKEQWIYPSSAWKSIKLESTVFEIDPDYYVRFKQL